jgi:hypothetical protein
MSESNVVAIRTPSDQMFESWLGGLTMRQVADEFGVPLQIVRRAIESRKVPNTPQGRMELQDRRITRIAQAMDDLWKDIENGERKHSALLLYERLDSRLDDLLGPHSVTRLDEPKVALVERPSSTDRIMCVLNQIAATRPPEPAPVLELEPVPSEPAA